MGANTKIEWCDFTFNGWEGCTKVSPGCVNCYAENRNARFGGGTAPNWGKGAPRRRTSAANWNQPLKWNREAEKSSLYETTPRGIEKIRPRVFCASLADWLDDEVPIEWLADLLDLIRRTPHLDWLLLTKRPQNFRERIAGAINHVSTAPSCTDAAFILIDWMQGWQSGNRIPANVWVGSSVEDQPRADERIPLLLDIPARVRFLSMEPLLGHVDLWLHDNIPSQRKSGLYRPVKLKLHWVIVGSESGSKRRPMQTEWAEDIRRQCDSAGVAFFMKQMEVEGKKSTEIGAFPASLQHRSFPS